jgi:hypothetical protein
MAGVGRAASRPRSNAERGVARTNRYDGHRDFFDDGCPMNTLELLEAGQLAGATRLDLACGLTEFPQAIFTLADSLEVLNLSGNALTRLPDDLHRLHKLKVLFCSDNPFTELPACIGQCQQLSMVGFKANRIEHVPAQALPPNLRWLILTDNRIERLPEALGDCLQMQKLMLSGNRLRSLPDSLARLENLELLRLSANRLQALPDWLLRLPRLAWLAYAGNPMSEAFTTPHSDGNSGYIAWSDLQLGERLGEGASGVIYRAQLTSGQAVAVKLYKGAMTSDGSPVNEMNACIAAGEHPQLIEVLGRLSGHPEGAAGLVMTLIDPSFANLAGPPSLASCTRDIYDSNLAIDRDALLRLLQGMASVGAHLHARGINHGDFYAHNVLWRENGECLFGDFGGASFYPGDAGYVSQALERIEVRAFGLLFEELLTRCNEVDDSLWALQRQCVQPQVLARPSFAEITRNL